MSNFLPDILTRWIYLSVFTAEELAEVAECSASTIYAYAEGRRNCPFPRARRIARYASERHHNDIARSMIVARFEVSERGEAQANGSLDDEIGAITEALGQARRHHRSGRRDEVTRQIARLETQVLNLKAERDRLEP